MFLDSHVAGFASTHSKTRHSDVIWCHKHDRRDDGSMSTLITKLLRKQWIITICPLVSDCTIGYNFSVSCNTRLKSRRKIQSHSIYVSAKIHFDNFYSKQDIAVGIFHVRNNHFLTSQMFFDYRVASLSSTHSKTRQSDVIGCHEHRIRDHGSIPTLLTKLLKTLTLRYRCRYLPCTDSDILGLGFLITSSIMWISNRGHVFCIRGIRLHPNGVFSNVLMTKKRHDNRKTSDWSKSDCSVRGRYQQRYLVYYKR